VSPASRELTGEATRLTADVLVVGSGAGGAPTAAILAEAGFDVVVLEEGPLVRQGDVTPFSLEQMDRQYRAGGVTAAIGLPSIAYTEGCCAGGGTEVNSGLYRRPPEEVLDRWRQDRGLIDFDSDSPALIAFAPRPTRIAMNTTTVE
jgi:choline dehydrogenase-like flavoprotein